MTVQADDNKPKKVRGLSFEYSNSGIWFVVSDGEPSIFIAHKSLEAVIDDLPNVLRRVFDLPVSPLPADDVVEAAKEIAYQVLLGQDYDRAAAERHSAAEIVKELAAANLLRQSAPVEDDNETDESVAATHIRGKNPGRISVLPASPTDAGLSAAINWHEDRANEHAKAAENAFLTSTKIALGAAINFHRESADALRNISIASPTDAAVKALVEDGR